MARGIALSPHDVIHGINNDLFVGKKRAAVVAHIASSGATTFWKAETRQQVVYLDTGPFGENETYILRFDEDDVCQPGAK